MRGFAMFTFSVAVLSLHFFSRRDAAPLKARSSEKLDETLALLTIVQDSYVEAGSPQQLYDHMIHGLDEFLGATVETRAKDLKLIVGKEEWIGRPSIETLEQLTDAVSDIAELLDGPKSDRVATLINAMLRAMDPHSNLLSKAEYEDLRQGTDGEFGGLGMIVKMKDKSLVVTKSIEGSPADKSGILPQDKIVAIDGQVTFATPLDELMNRIRGPSDSLVNLTLFRKNARSAENLRLRRELVRFETVETKVLSDGQKRFLHAKIDQFSTRTSSELRRALNDFVSRGRASGIILDLRNNPGGLLDQAVLVSDIFLSEGLIVSTRGQENLEEYATSPRVDLPVVVLINNNSASAAEIVAGALQDSGRAIVVGQPSYGKGSVQSLYELEDGRALKMTVARYFTPSGRSIQGQGIIPDLWLQPIFKNRDNRDLMGTYRYRSEAFLPHSLRETAEMPLSKLQTFFLAESEEITSESDLSTELRVAVFLLRNQEGSKSIGQWLTTNLPAVNVALKTMDDEVRVWLRERFSIDWNRTTLNPSAVLQSSISVNELGRPVVHWSLTDANLDQGSIVVHDSEGRIRSEERLLGSVLGAAQGEIPLSVSDDRRNEESPLHVILSSGAQNLAVSSLPFVNTSPDAARLSFEYRNGKFGEGELTIRNFGNLKAEAVELRLINLMGDGIAIESDLHTIEEIVPHSEKVIQLKYRCIKCLEENYIGVQASSASLIKDASSYFSVPGDRGRSVQGH